jgi:diacylglycerol kinase
MRNFLFSFKYAFSGLCFMFKNERNFKVQFFIFVITIILGFLLNITRAEFIYVLLISSLILGLEIINSSIEKVLDFIHQDKNPKVKVIKDISAGATLLASIFGLVIGALIFIPKIYSLLI